MTFTRKIAFFVIFAFATITFSCKHTEPITPPAEVTDFTAAAMDTKILLSWTEPEDEDFSGVEISCEPKAGSLENSATLKKGVSSLIVYGLENGTEYTFTIKTFDTSGNFSVGTTCTGTPVDSSDKTPPAEAGDFKSAAMDSKVMLSWTEPKDEDFSGVEISCEPKAGSLENPATLKKGSASIFVYGLENGTEYTFTIKTFDTNGNFSTGVTCTGTPIDSSDKTPPAEVTDFTAEAMDSAVKLSWIDASDDDLFGYELTWTPKNSAAISRAVTTMDSDSIFISPSGNERNEITISNLLNGTEYTFTLKSMDTSGNKSEGVVAKGKPTATPDVSRLTAIYYDGKTHISWSNPSGISGVEIFADGKKVGETNVNYLVTDYGDSTTVFLLKTRNQFEQLSNGIAIATVETGLPILSFSTINNTDVFQRDVYVDVTMTLFNGTSNEVYENMKISVRGNATSGYPKKPYKIKLDKKKSLLGMKSESKKWTLLAGYCDKTLLRTELGFKTAEILGMEYVPDRRFVDVFINGEYKGNYLLCDSVEQDDARVPVKKKTGCIIEIDGYYSREPYYFKTEKLGLPFTFKHPDGDDIAENKSAAVEIAEYIENYMNDFETVLTSESYADTENGYSKYIDVNSFIQWLLVQEITANLDTNTYFYKEDNTLSTKLKMGPVWDFEWSVGIGWYYGERPKDVSGWVRKNSSYFDYLTKDLNFTDEIKNVWEENYDEIETLCDYIDEKAKEINKSQQVNFQRWPILNSQVSVGGIPLGSYEAELECDKQYLANRIAWLNTEITN